MKPILFEEDATQFNTNGTGRLSDALSCIVTEERNGSYELEMEYPITGQHYTELALRRIIAAQPSVDAALQPFRIYRITKPINGKIRIYAQHISYDLSKNTVMPFSVAAAPGACAAALAGLKANAVETCPFTFETDVTTNAPYKQTAPATIRSRLGGVEGSVLDQFGGEYEFDNFRVIFHNARGSDNGVSLRYGKNITDISQEENISNTITGVVPFWTNFDGSETVTLTEKAVYSPYASRYSQKMTIPLDLSDQYEDKPTEAQIRARAQSYINQSSLGIPKVSIEVSFVDLRDTAGYEDVRQLETVHLCDMVTVQFVPLSIDVKAEVVKCEYDVLAERYKKVTIGNIRSSLASAITDQNAQTITSIIRSNTGIGQAIENATAWLTSANGYVVAVKNTDGSWKELLFMDALNPDDATNGIRINNSGIGFWRKSIDGGNVMDGPYSNAWTIDGNLIADFIHGGTLTLGGNNNTDGWLKIVNANNVQIGKWDKDGISANGGTFSGTVSGSNITGSTINWGSGTNTATMYWKPNVSEGRGVLYIETYDNPSYTDQITIKTDLLYILASLWTNGDLHVGYTNAAADLYINGNLYLNANKAREATQVWESSGSGLIQYWFKPADYPPECVNFYISGTSQVAFGHQDTGKQLIWSNSSDRRLKEDIRDISNGLLSEFFKKIKPVSFSFKKDAKKKTHYGLIAQELEEVQEELGMNTELVGETNDVKYIDYLGLVGICLGAIKDLYKQVENLEEELKNAKSDNQS